MPKRIVIHTNNPKVRRRVTQNDVMRFYRYLRTNPEGVLDGDLGDCVNLFCSRYSNGRRPHGNSKFYNQMKAWFRKLQALHRLPD